MMRYDRDPLADPEPLVRRVYAYVAYRIGDGHDADDVTADVFERALRFRDRYDPSRGEPAAWLIGIARRCIADRFRANDAVAPPPVAHERDLEHDVTERLTLRAAVAKLGPRDRELIALRYGADLTAREIGRVLGLRTNAVQVALHRVHARLRAHLSPRAAVVARPLARPLVESAPAGVSILSLASVLGAEGFVGREGGTP
jgi:RNA polymerase sigma-70 factor (ECF subfamily)